MEIYLSTFLTHFLMSCFETELSKSGYFYRIWFSRILAVIITLSTPSLKNVFFPLNSPRRLREDGQLLFLYTLDIRNGNNLKDLAFLENFHTAVYLTEDSYKWAH